MAQAISHWLNNEAFAGGEWQDRAGDESRDR